MKEIEKIAFIIYLYDCVWGDDNVNEKILNEFWDKWQKMEGKKPINWDRVKKDYHKEAKTIIEFLEKTLGDKKCPHT